MVSLTNSPSPSQRNILHPTLWKDAWIQVVSKCMGASCCIRVTEIWGFLAPALHVTSVAMEDHEMEGGVPDRQTPAYIYLCHEQGQYFPQQPRVSRKPKRLVKNWLHMFSWTVAATSRSALLRSKPLEVKTQNTGKTHTKGLSAQGPVFVPSGWRLKQWTCCSWLVQLTPQ